MKAYLCDAPGCTECVEINPAADVLPTGWVRADIAKNGEPPVQMHWCGKCSVGKFELARRAPTETLPLRQVTNIVKGQRQ